MDRPRDHRPDDGESGRAVALQQVANALSIGAIYALIALGYTMVYGIIELINFAHGDVFMVGAFMSLFFLASARPRLPRPAPDRRRSDDARSCVAASSLARARVRHDRHGRASTWRIERVVLPAAAPRAARWRPLITAIGVSFILQNIVLIVAGTGDRGAPQIFPTHWRVEIVRRVDRRPELRSSCVIALILMVRPAAVRRRTRLGRAMRATAQDRRPPQLMGVDVNQTIALTFLLGGALAGAAGVV